MNTILKKIKSAVIAVPLKFLSSGLKTRLVMKLTDSAISNASPKEALEFLFEIDNRLYSMQGKAARAYGKGIHTKHRHLKYHDFFVKNIKTGERVLDIGSGIGYMCDDIARKVPSVQVVGLELNKDNISFAREHYQRPNLKFIQVDSRKELPDGKFDVVTLSNVLEHIEQRVELLKKIRTQVKPKRFIIRVPLFERDWRVPLKKELGIDYRLDSSHFIEYTQEGFCEELRQAGLKATHLEVRWGEIWSVAETDENATSD